jgi:energy-coupling factor transport system ATP-binding protein
VSLIHTEKLNYVYGAGTPFEKKALDDINISIEKGDFIGIIGHTGSGKSTLIQHFNGLIKATSGTVFVDEADIWADKKKIRNIRFKVGLVFQYPEYQLFEETVEKDIAYGPKNMGLSDDEIKDRVKEAINFVGLNESYLKKSPFDLSGGEKRRVAIAGIIAMKPQVLILDEPTAGLDPKGREDILNQIKKYHETEGNTVITVSHSMEDVADVSNKVLVMNHGKVEMFDNTRHIFANSRRLSEIGLDIPYFTKIILKLKEKGFLCDEAVYTQEQAKEVLISLLNGGGINA